MEKVKMFISSEIMNQVINLHGNPVKSFLGTTNNVYIKQKVMSPIEVKIWQFIGSRIVRNSIIKIKQDE